MSPSAGASDRTLRRARTVLGALTAGVLVPLAASGWGPGTISLPGLSFAAGLLGLVAPVLGYRLYLLQAERVPPGADAEARRGAYLRGVLLAASVTEAIALLGVVTHALGGAVPPLVGALTHVLLVGAIWPTPEKLEGFLEQRPAGGREG